MGRKIILCSDGTGNRGGVGYETNVWRLYKGLDLTNSSKQIAFYDDGVGTQDLVYLKRLAGAVGWGFERNVKQLYTSFARNYERGDELYFFGFSRGAYTVRALAAFIAECGVIRGAANMTDVELDKQVTELADDYGKRRDQPGFEPRIAVDPVPEIEFIGVWDTVSALALPFDIWLKDWLLHRFVPLRLKDNKPEK